MFKRNKVLDNIILEIENNPERLKDLDGEQLDVLLVYMKQLKENLVKNGDNK